MRRQSDGSYVPRSEADAARYAQYYVQNQQPQRRSRHRSTGSGSIPPAHSSQLQQYLYQAGPPIILSRPRDPAAEANDMINAMCSLTSYEAQNLDWILDLEFGPPMQAPSNRHVAYYDPSKRMIMSASQPNTVHPNFLRCNEKYRDLLIENYMRREMRASMPAAAAHAQPPPQPIPSLPVNYHELYRMMEEQKNMQNALMAASRQAYGRQM